MFGSKLAALIDRCQPRDLYDIYGLINSNIKIDNDLLRKCAIFYNCVGGDGDILVNDFAKLDGITEQSIKRMLKPVLPKNDRFDYKIAIIDVKNYLKELFKITGNEELFVKRFKENKYMPELLFDIEHADRVRNHPMAIWKTQDKN